MNEISIVVTKYNYERVRLINMQCKIIIKQNDHDVCKTGLDKEHAGVDV